jgi:hypothetical protein
MTTRRRMFAMVMTSLTAAAIAEAQPGDQPADGNGSDSGSSAGSGAGSATAPPAKSTTKPMHVRARTELHASPTSDSDVVFAADPPDELFVTSLQGEWALVKARNGITGWVPSAKLVTEGEVSTADVDAPPKPVVKPKPPRPRDPPIAMPTVLTTPTGWLLPAAVLYSRTGLDTGGGVTSDSRVGLGEVAEFGVSTTDQVRARRSLYDNGKATTADAIQPYVAATFRMGVAEHRLFDAQPGIVLGYRKSFKRESDGFTTRIAELTLVASKHLGSHAAIHVGWAFWDASLTGTNVDTALHDHSTFTIGDQLRAFGGLQVTPINRAQILVDLGWAPEFCYECTGPGQIRLRPELAWGVRYEVTDFMHLESGVRIPDISAANLLDAQIFGAVTFTTWGLRHAVDDLK